ncbi:MAG: hypothetical protein LUF92_17570 [Clostridiales bacterium]|nr:hypothetical protein [Clostridiales bacterium]
MKLLKRNTPEKSNRAEYLQQAEQATDIVQSGVENGNFLDMNRKLQKLTQEENSKERFIFDYPPIFLAVITLIICISFTIGYILSFNRIWDNDLF